jgi:hypothetical protein
VGVAVGVRVGVGVAVGGSKRITNGKDTMAVTVTVDVCALIDWMVSPTSVGVRSLPTVFTLKSGAPTLVEETSIDCVKPGTDRANAAMQRVSTIPRIKRKRRLPKEHLRGLIRI